MTEYVNEIWRDACRSFSLFIKAVDSPRPRNRARKITDQFALFIHIFTPDVIPICYNEIPLSIISNENTSPNTPTLSTDDSYTVLAPSNAAYKRVKITEGFSNRDHIAAVLRNHILLGQVVTEERLKQLKDGDTFTVPTLLGTRAVFSNRNGEYS